MHQQMVFCDRYVSRFQRNILRNKHHVQNMSGDMDVSMAESLADASGT